MGRAGEAVDATMLTAAIGVDRAVEGDVRRVVARDDVARLLVGDLGLEGRQLFQRTPAIILRDALLGLVAPARIDRGSAPPAPFRVDAVSGIGRRVGRATTGAEMRAACPSCRLSARGALGCEVGLG